MAKCTILTVEDEPAISDILRVNLSFAGYDVISANNVTQAENLMITHIKYLAVFMVLAFPL